MKAPFHLLQTFAAELPEARRLANALTAGGLEVGRVSPAAEAFSGLVVGRVERVEPIANTRLSLCAVDAANHGQFQIVCGAPNVAVGGLYPLAVPGAVLPGGLKIGKRKLAGVQSEGMLCSEAELGLGEDADGILLLPEDLEVGACLRGQLQLDSPVLELDLTPNRADCFSLEGIARDAAALAATDFAPLAVDEVPAEEDGATSVRLEAPQDCPRYLCRGLVGVDARAASPFWLKEALRRMGQRSLGAIVDVTNYVMLELGQPLHAFDRDKVAGGIRVRNASDSERIRLLDDSEHALLPTDLLIADDSGPLALAGVMGGGNSEVGQDTKAVLLESAFFRPATIARTSRRLSLSTEASRRFERGVRSDLQMRAIQRASALILEICGGRAGPVTEAVGAEHLPAGGQLSLSAAALNAALGAEADAEAVGAGFRRLGLKPQRTGDGWQITVPPWRFDLAGPEDLVEEAARILGFDRLPEAPMVWGDRDADRRGGRRNETQLRQMRQMLLHLGWTETLNYSFESPQLQQQLLPSAAEHALELASPLTNTQSVMRLSLVPGLLQTLHHNLTHRQRRLRLFETGRCFRRAPDGGIDQTEFFAGLICGPRNPLSWTAPIDDNHDFFDARGTLEALFAGRAVELDFRPPPAEAQLPDWIQDWMGQQLHPGRRAVILLRPKPRPDRDARMPTGSEDQRPAAADSSTDRASWAPVGWVGCLHPRLAAEFDARHEVVYFEMRLDALPDLAPGPPSFAPFARFPRVRRDLSLLLPASVEAAELLREIRLAGGDELVSCDLFDLQLLPDGASQVAVALQWQPQDGTWTAERIQSAVDQVLTRLQQFGVSLRLPDAEGSAAQ